MHLSIPILLLLFHLVESDLSDFEEEDYGLAIPKDAVGRPINPLELLKGGKEEPTLNNECYCSYGTQEGVCLRGKKCIKESKAACYHATELMYNETTRESEILHMYGCATLERGSDASHLTCHAHLLSTIPPRSIACCYEGFLCNLNITPPPFIGYDEEYIPDGPITPRSFPFYLIAIISLLMALLAFGYFKWFRNSNQKPKRIPLTDVEAAEDKDMIDSSGSGSCGAPLNQRTVAQDLHIIKVIGRGRYGEVRKAEYRGSFVAVKTFYTTDEDSWMNERDIYYSEMFNHENVLQFVAADIYSEDSITQMLLITDYHEFGSLSEYLRSQETFISPEEALSLAHSIICGLDHLHSPVFGTGGRVKPQIAHRDLKSRNIIVKRRGCACIADFGLAVRFDGEIIPKNPKIQVGTKRYMAPEILSKSLNTLRFDNFKMADMYSLSLIFWEILTTIKTADPSSPMSSHKSESSLDSGIASASSNSSGERGPAKAQHQQHKTSMEMWTRSPYEGLVGSDPSFDDMIRVVCAEGKRPSVDLQWKNSRANGISTLTRVMEECWHAKAVVRPSALRVKLDLKTAIETNRRYEVKLQEERARMETTQVLSPISEIRGGRITEENVEELERERGPSKGNSLLSNTSTYS